MAKLKINFENTKKISPILYGVFFEDINRAADGGLYGELIANNSFEYFSSSSLVIRSTIKFSNFVRRYASPPFSAALAFVSLTPNAYF